MLNYEKSDHIATITIDNPPVNVFTPVMHKQMFEILHGLPRPRLLASALRWKAIIAGWT